MCFYFLFSFRQLRLIDHSVFLYRLFIKQNVRRGPPPPQPYETRETGPQGETVRH